MSATREFELQDGDRLYRYKPGHEVRFNGQRGRIWERHELIKGGGWVFCGQRFHPLRATRKDIA